VQLYCNDDLKSRNGNDGWSLDISDRSEQYQAAVEQLKKGEVSPVFTDTNGYSFIWIDRTYTLPKADEKASYDLDAMPKTLAEYFRDSVARQYWQLDCQVYLQRLLAESNTNIYAMPSDVQYNVEMNL